MISPLPPDSSLKPSLSAQAKQLWIQAKTTFGLGNITIHAVKNWLPVFGLALLLTVGLAASLILISTPQDLRQQAYGTDLTKPRSADDARGSQDQVISTGVTCAGGYTSGQKACAGFRSVVTCEQTGLFSAPVTCDVNKICQNGQCVTQPPQSCFGGINDGQKACSNSREVVTCRSGSFVEPTLCPDGQSCTDGRCSGPVAPARVDLPPKPSPSITPTTPRNSPALLPIPLNIVNGRACQSNEQCQSGYCIAQPNLRAKFCQAGPTPDKVPSTAGIACYEVVNGDCQMRFYAGTTTCAVGTATKLAECQTECLESCRSLGLSTQTCQGQCWRPEVGISGPATVVCYNALGATVTKLLSQGCPTTHPSINAPAVAGGSCAGTTTNFCQAGTVLNCTKGTWTAAGTCSPQITSVEVSSTTGTRSNNASRYFEIFTSLLGRLNQTNTSSNGTNPDQVSVDPDAMDGESEDPVAAAPVSTDNIITTCRNNCLSLPSVVDQAYCDISCLRIESSACNPSDYITMTPTCTAQGGLLTTCNAAGQVICKQNEPEVPTEPVKPAEPLVSTVFQQGCAQVGQCVANENRRLVYCEAFPENDMFGNSALIVRPGTNECPQNLQPLTLQNENGCTQVGQCVGDGGSGVVQCELATYTDEYSGASGTYLRAGSVSCITETSNLDGCLIPKQCVNNSSGQSVRCERTVQVINTSEVREVFFAGTQSCNQFIDSVTSSALSTLQFFGLGKNLEDFTP